MPKIKNILIFAAIGTIFILIYIFFLKPKPPVATLISSPISVLPQNPTIPDNKTLDKSGVLAKDFLTLLLSVKSIKLDDTIFSDNAFIGLHDSSITLTPDGNEGRVNPFAPLGMDAGTSVTP